MGTRLELQALLVDALGSSHVYFQPPPTIKMVYPCIIYHRDYATTKHADNKPYGYQKRYLVVVVDQNPDSVIPEKVAALPKCIYDRSYTTDNLNHDAYRLFF